MHLLIRWRAASRSLPQIVPASALLAGALLMVLPHAGAAVSPDSPHADTKAIVIAQADDGAPASRADARAMVQLMNQLDALNRELSKLRGKVEELNNGILNAEKRQKDMYLDLDTRLRRVESSNEQLLNNLKKAAEAYMQLHARVEKLEQAAATAADIPPPVATAPAEGQATNAAVLRDYEAAMAKYRAAEYQDAITAFQAIVRQYPQHPLAVNAQYWTGDAYYQLRAFRSAIDAQKTLIEQHPNSAKAADAMLNMGSALIGLEDIPAARQTWQKLIATYPNSRAAKNAQERLKRLP